MSQPKKLLILNNNRRQLKFPLLHQTMYQGPKLHYIEAIGSTQIWQHKSYLYFMLFQPKIRLSFVSNKRENHNFPALH